ncbi:MAG: hypothetical protein N2117_13660 [Anaerolineales bacterium]|nr:hypothetical protein [Anaerolineales bacterium]MCX7756272.1 hypothetical protein [Anaerolineales bacterium]MDW8276647.1 hypothetical protein [Anaerolineales bacterium]
MTKEWRDVIIAVAGFVYGVWLYYLYSEDGWAALVADWWKGLIPSLVVIAIAVLWYHFRKTEK